MSLALAEKTEFVDFSPFNPDFRDNRFEYYPTLVEASPCFTMVEGVPSAVIGSCPHNQAVLRNFKGFSSLKPAGLPGMENDILIGLPVMNYSYPPEDIARTPGLADTGMNDCELPYTRSKA